MDQISKESLRIFCSSTAANETVARRYLSAYKTVEMAVDAYFEDKSKPSQTNQVNIPKTTQAATFIIDNEFSNPISSGNSQSIKIIDDDDVKQTSKPQFFSKGGESAFKKFNQTKPNPPQISQSPVKNQKHSNESSPNLQPYKAFNATSFRQNPKNPIPNSKPMDKSPTKNQKTPEKLQKKDAGHHTKNPKMLTYDSDVIGSEYDSEGVNTSSSVEAAQGLSRKVYEMKEQSNNRTHQEAIDDDDNDSIESIITKSKFIKNRRFRARPLNPAIEIILDGENLPLKIRKDYTEYIKPYWHVPKGKFTLKDRWPKYLGSIVVDCKLHEKGDFHIKVGDPLTFKAGDIEFGYKNVNPRGIAAMDYNRQKNKEVVCFVKNHLLYTTVFHKNVEIGVLWCRAEEIFVFLLSKNYIMLEGTVLTPIQNSLGVKRFRMQLDILLTERTVSNPLKIRSVLDMPRKKRQKDLEEPDAEDGFTQEESHILRLTKDAMIRLFEILKLKVKVPTVITSQYMKEDAFTKLLKEKYNKSTDNFQGPAPALITKTFPRYYSIDQYKLQADSQKNPSQKKIQVFDLTLDDTDVQELYENEYLGKKAEEERKVDNGIIAGINSNFFRQVDPSSSCKAELHPYQKQALTWMLYREDCLTDNQLYLENAERFRKLHDLFQEMLLIDNSELYFNPFDGKVSVEFPRSKLCKGGILADEMGLGKTVVAIALIHSHRPMDRKLKKKKNHNSHEAMVEEKVQEKRNNLKKMIQALKKVDTQDSFQAAGVQLPVELEEPDKPAKDKAKKGKNKETAAAGASNAKTKDGEKKDKAKKDLVDEFLASVIPDINPKELQEANSNSMNIEALIPRRHSSDSDEDIDPPESLWARVKQNNKFDNLGLKKSMKQLKKTTGADKIKQEETIKELLKKHSDDSTDEEMPSKSKTKDNGKDKKKDSKKKDKEKNKEKEKDNEKEKEKEKEKGQREKDQTKKEDEFEPKAKKVKQNMAATTKENEETKKIELVDLEEENRKGGTLIIMPLTVLVQWENEFYTHSEENSVTVLQYYGTSRKRNKLAEYDVVLTTYGVLEYEYAHPNEGVGLADIEWFRIILDEAHQIKSRVTKTSKAAFNLKASYRWCMTGTPLQNKLDDLFSILQFLQMEIWGDYFWWNNYINKYSTAEEASEIARMVLQPILLRRTKKSTYENGRGILDLPPKEIRTCWVKLTEEERKIYSLFYLKGKERFDEVIRSGKLQFEYAHIFELLIRLRQVCDHPSLVFKKDEVKDKESLECAISKFMEKHEQKNGAPTEHVTKTLESLRKNRLEPCSICLEQIAAPVLTSCGHVFCKECILKSYEVSKKCPYCNSEIENEDFITVLDDEENDDEMAELRNIKTSSKLTAVINQVKNVQKRGEKCVVFSQFIKMMNLIEQSFQEEKIEYRRIDGSTRMQVRARNIEEFKTQPSITVILISLKAGCAGINLTAANNVFLVDPWWNPAIEDQAIERVYRIGQIKKVNVIRFICEKTIEARMFELNEKKKKMISLTLCYNPEDAKHQNLDNIAYVMQDFD